MTTVRWAIRYLNVLTFQMVGPTSAKRMLELGLSENLSFQAMDRLCERTDDLFRKNEFRVSIIRKCCVFKKYDAF